MNTPAADRILYRLAESRRFPVPGHSEARSSSPTPKIELKIHLTTNSGTRKAVTTPSYPALTIAVVGRLDDGEKLP